MGKSHSNALLHTLWKFNIAIENDPFIVDLPTKMVIFHSYVCLPEGNVKWKFYWETHQKLGLGGMNCPKSESPSEIQNSHPKMEYPLVI